MFAALLIAAVVQGSPPLLDSATVHALATTLSGDRPHETVRQISANHRMRGSRGFRSAAEIVASKARAAGLDSVRIEEFPADGKIFYGTQKSRPPWDVEFAELRELGSNRIVASWDKVPMSLAQDSESGEATAELVDVGAGTTDSSYIGKNVRGKLILTSSQPSSVVPLGITKYGAVGIVSYAQNQRTAWWGENTDLIRWGHLDTFSPTKTFAFMVSPRVANAYKARLAKGEKISMHAKVKAGKHPGAYSIVTAKIPGADARLANEEIVFTCHLDHPDPGANDNASGCATILEVAVTLQKLINEKRIVRPARTMRFVWPPEIEGSVVILNAKPEWAKRIKAVVHMDMVGGGPESKAVFHVSSGPGSLPSFVYDIGHSFGAWVNEQTYQYAATGSSSYPLVSAKGGKEPLLAALDEFSMGSDHEVYSDASWAIPAIYLHDWPDRYIHTTWDTPERIDPTKLLRAAFIGGASGYFLASATMKDSATIRRSMGDGYSRYRMQMSITQRGADSLELVKLAMWNSYVFEEREKSWRTFLAGPPNIPRGLNIRYERGSVTGDSALVFVRKRNPKGPMSVFGYDYLQDRIGAERYSGLKLIRYQGLRGSGGDYAYEVLNLTSWGMRTIDIHNIVTALYGRVPLEFIVEYLRALEDGGVVTRSPTALNRRDLTESQQ